MNLTDITLLRLSFTTKKQIKDKMVNGVVPYLPQLNFLHVYVYRFHKCLSPLNRNFNTFNV